jgi:hypothetical protein
LLDSVRADVEERLTRSFSSFQGIAYRSQVVAGINYLFRVEADELFLLVKIFKPLPHTGLPPQLLNVEEQQ